MTKIISIVGNPKPQSKTSEVAVKVSEQLTKQFREVNDVVTTDIIELSDIAPYLFEWGNEEVEKYVDTVLHADILIVASPTYKATYTGLLKAFLDQFPQDGLEGKIAIPVMIGASPQHKMGIDAYLTPLLLELGAGCPKRGLYILESNLNHLPHYVTKWLLNGINLSDMIS